MIWRGHAFSAALLLAILLICAKGVAEAHGGGPGLNYDPCMRQAGADNFVHLAAYQPEFNPFAEYCDTLPRSGEILLVFDLMGVELPDAPVSLALVQDRGGIHLAVPARRYRSAVFKLEADLPPGKYTALVTIADPHGLHRLAFPLQVGAWWSPLVVPLLFVLLIIVVAAGYCVYQLRGLAAERRRHRHKLVSTDFFERRADG